MEISSGEEEDEVSQGDLDAFIESTGIFGDASTCTYEKGALDQYVMACLDCSQAAGRTVAVCIACAFRCHRNHEQVEVGAKKSLRCDCSAACAYNTTHAERPPNESNVYAPQHNFEGRFCWCDTRFEGQEGVPPPSLSQCFACSEWFHLSCVDIPEDAEEGCLICRDCVHHLQRYIPSLELGSESPATEPPASCPELLPLSPSIDPRAARSVLLIPNFRQLLCQCAPCRAKYDTLLLSYQGDGEISTQDIFRAAMEGLPHDQQIELAHMGAKLHTAIEEAKAVLSASKRRPLDESDVAAIFEDVMHRIEKKPKRGGD
jgi:hypothetical protein